MGSGCKISWEKGGEGGPETERDRDTSERHAETKTGERDGETDTKR